MAESMFLLSRQSVQTLMEHGVPPFAFRAHSGLFSKRAPRGSVLIMRTAVTKRTKRPPEQLDLFDVQLRPLKGSKRLGLAVTTWAIDPRSCGRTSCDSCGPVCVLAPRGQR